MTFGRLLPLGLAVLAGCSPATPPPSERPATSVPITPTKATPPAAEARPIALLEPYLVPASPTKTVIPPPSLRGGITPHFDPAPLIPTPPPTQVVPIEPTPPRVSPARPVPPPVATPNLDRIVTAVARLLSTERQHALDLARARKTAADLRATQTAETAKKVTALVRAGAVAQRQGDDADKAARDAVQEQADAAKAVADAEERLAAVRTDVEAALRAVAMGDGFELAQAPVVSKLWVPMPGTYRLSILEGDPKEIAVEGGTLGRRMPLAEGESGAWIVRTANPKALRVRLGKVEAKTYLRPGPEQPAAKPVL